jgi:hypothetical protein
MIIPPVIAGRNVIDLQLRCLLVVAATQAAKTIARLDAILEFLRRFGNRDWFHPPELWLMCLGIFAMFNGV